MNPNDTKITQSLAIGLFFLAMCSCSSNQVTEESEEDRTPKIEVVVGGVDTEIYEGDMSQEAFRRTIRSRLIYIRDCYEAISKNLDDPDSTRIVARIEIHNGGEARNVRLIENTHTNKARAMKLGDCLTAVLSATKFPSPQSRKAVQVIYPFEFHLRGGTKK